MLREGFEGCGFGRGRFLGLFRGGCFEVRDTAEKHRAFLLPEVAV